MARELAARDLSQTAVRAVRGTAAVVSGGSLLAESVADILDRVHRDTSPAMGRLCIALERRRVSPFQLRAWAESLQRGAHDLLKLAETLERARDGATDN